MQRAISALPLLLAMVGSPAQSETWREVSKVGDTSGYIDTESIKRDGDKVRFRLDMRLFLPEGTRSGHRYDRIASTVEIDCREKTYRILRIGAKLGDRSVFGGKSPDKSVNPIRPGTTVDDEMRAVCSDEWGGGR
jgi:hypothetical protein